jgi:hypothetical protein
VSYPKKLLRLRPTRGLSSDTPASELSEEFYSIGRNVNFRGGFAGRILGSRAVYGTMPVTVQHLLNARIDGTNFWLVFGADEIHALETSNSDEVTGAALQAITQPWQWASSLLNGIPVVTNGLDAPRYWAGAVAVPFVDLPDWPAGTICKSLTAFRFHVFAFDIDGPAGHFEAQVKWSDAAPPGTVPSTWTAAANNEAGDMELSDTPGPALTGVPMRGSLIAYKRSSMYAIDYVGGEEVFAQRTLFTSSGALTRHAVCDVNGQHFVVTDGDIILTDGTNRRSVGQDRMREFMFGQLDQDNYENVFTVYHRAKREVLVAFPEAGEQYPTLALVYDVERDRFGVRDLASVPCAAVGIVNDEALSEAWDDDAEAWDDDDSAWNSANFSLATESLVIGYDDVMELQDTQDAVAIPALIGRYDLTFGEPERVKFVRNIHVRAKPTFGTLYVRIGARMDVTGTISWSAEMALVEPAQLVNTFALGRYISVEVRSQDSNVWTVTGIDIEAEMRGYF